MFSSKRLSRSPLWVVISGLGLACVERAYYIDRSSYDIENFLTSWLGHIYEKGQWISMGSEISNYAPLYVHFLTLSSYVFVPGAEIYAIKGVSFFFDLVLAIGCSLLVQTITGSRLKGVYAFVVVLCAPTVVMNSASWGQFDSGWTSFLVLALYCLARRMVGLAFFSFGLSFAAKLQSLWLAPLMGAVYLINKQYLKCLALFVAPYLLFAVVPVVNGRSVVDVLLVYMNQTSALKNISMHAANFWFFVPNDYYTLGTVVGVCAGIIFTVALMTILVRNPKLLDGESLVVVALLCVHAVPFILPKMHERYFFASDVLSLVMCLIKPRLWFLALSLQVSSLIALKSWVSLSVAAYPMFVAVSLNFGVFIALCILVLSAKHGVVEDDYVSVAGRVCVSAAFASMFLSVVFVASCWLRPGGYFANFIFPTKYIFLLYLLMFYTVYRASLSGRVVKVVDVYLAKRKGGA